MKNRIIYLGESLTIYKAVQKANFLLNDVDFHEKLVEKENFLYADISGAIISELIYHTKVRPVVEIYPSMWNFGRLYGYTSPTLPNKIFLNKRNLSQRDTDEITCTLIQEFIYLLNYENTAYSFVQEDEGKGVADTAPFWISNLAVAILRAL